MKMTGIPRNKSSAAKVICLVVILILSAQYFMNALMYNRKQASFLTVISYAVETGNRSTSNFIRQFMPMTTPKAPELCPLIPPDIRGRIPVNIQVPAWAYVEEQNQMLSPGGRYKPEGCVARHRVAIIIPYRDRDIHLKIFLQNIHPFLRSQQLDYGIFVVEMAKNVRFNRAALLNIGFLEASKLYDFQCFIFHDVDLLPEDDRNLYVCPSMPRHMSVAIDKLKYKLPYPQIFGGVSAIKKDHFEKINGFSNLYFGWGGEDDDMYKRILYANLTVTRYSTEVARYKMLSHVKDKGNPQRFSMLRSTRARRLLDGINSIKYTRLKLEFRPLYTWIYVTMNETETMNNKPIKAKIEAVLAALAKIAREKAKAEQAKNKSNNKLQQTPKPAQISTAQNGKPVLTSSAQSPKPDQISSAQNQDQSKANSAAKSKPTPTQVALAQARRAQLQSALEAHRAKVIESSQTQSAEQAQGAESNDPNPGNVQNIKPIQPKSPPMNVPAVQANVVTKVQAKVVPKPAPGPFGRKPEFVSWVPTNATVPERLVIGETLGLGPGQMKQPKRLLNAKEVS